MHITPYLTAERKMRRLALTALKGGDSHEATRLLDLARHAGMAFVRNNRGRKADEWEKPPTEVVR